MYLIKIKKFKHAAMAAGALLAALAMVVTGLVFQTNNKDSLAISGDWQNYASPQWLDTSDARYAGYFAEPGSSADQPYLIKTAEELAGLDIRRWCVMSNRIELYSAEPQFFSDAINNCSLAGLYIDIAPDDGVLDLSAHYWSPINLYGTQNPQSPEICTGADCNIVNNPYGDYWYCSFGSVERDCEINGDEFRSQDAVLIDGKKTLIYGLNVKGYNEGWLQYFRAPGSDQINEDLQVGASGLFGYVYKTRVRNIDLVRPTIDLKTNQNSQYGTYSVGSLVGLADKSYVTFNNVFNPNIRVQGDAGSVIVGGLVGYTSRKSVVATSSVNGGLIDLSNPTGNAPYVQYAGGAVGMAYRTTMTNVSTDTNIKILNPWDLNNSSQYEVYAGGIVGAITVRDVAKGNSNQVCLYNSYSRTNLDVDVAAVSLYAGGVAGQLEDSAINTYYKGGDITAKNSLVQLATQEGWDPLPVEYIGEVFGYVGSSSNANPLESDIQPIDLLNGGDLHVLQNYYVDGVHSAVGGTDQGVLSNANVAQVNSGLLGLMESGREAVIQDGLDHGAVSYEQLSANIEHWCSTGLANDGYPIFARNCVDYGNPTVTPNQGPVKGGTEVTIPGTNLDKISEVLIGGADCTIIYRSTTEIRCVTAAHEAGLVDVVLSGDGGVEIVLANAFTYIAPQIVSVSPNSGPVAGGTELTITGQGFGELIDRTLDGEIVQSVGIICSSVYDKYDNGGGGVRLEATLVGTQSSVYAASAEACNEGTKVVNYHLTDAGTLYEAYNGDLRVVDTSAVSGEIVRIQSLGNYEEGEDYLLIVTNTGGVYAMYDDGTIEHLFDHTVGAITQINGVVWAGSNDYCDYYHGYRLYVIDANGGLWDYYIEDWYCDGGNYAGTNQGVYNIKTWYVDSAIKYIDNEGNFISENNTVYYIVGDGMSEYLDYAWTNQLISNSNIDGQIIGMAAGNGDGGMNILLDEDGNVYTYYYDYNNGDESFRPANVGYLPAGDKIIDVKYITDYCDYYCNPVYMFETQDGRFYLQETMWMSDGNVGGYILLAPQLYESTEVDYFKSSVMLDQNGVQAPCIILSWTDAEIHCLTTTHFAGQVGIAINGDNGVLAALNNAFTYVGSENITPADNNGLVRDIPGVPNTGNSEIVLQSAIARSSAGMYVAFAVAIILAISLLRKKIASALRIFL